ncbi:toprim domain-containing protein [Kaustia mangrovi]|uniref:Toprim domain-containing protein n=2 Tax=Kaustia mangrovi TaxID=2593653 RepID=A0A7S8C7Y8_9HYPH|nr:toprim domain-containing protein [Kaustia mangrovi]
MLVTNDVKGYRGYCFRCGAKPFVSHGLFSVQELRRRKAELALTESKTVALPKDFTTDIPPREAVWLYMAGIGSGLARHYGFGYSPSLKRVVLPVYDNGKLLGFTARSTINARPKYIERMVSPSEAVFVSCPSAALPSAKAWAEASGPGVVFTEDILSAVRVGRLVRRSVSLLGTSASDAQLSRALRDIPPQAGWIGLWLDGDAPGRRAASRLARTLTLMGYEVQNIYTESDPRAYSNREIRRILTL